MLLAESCPEYRATSGGKIGEGPTSWKLPGLVRDESHTCVGNHWGIGIYKSGYKIK